MAIEKELIIKLNLDPSKANKSGEQYNDAQKKRINDLLSAEEVAERAKSAIVERENQRRIQEAIKASSKEEQMLTQALTREQVAFQAKDALIRKHNQARIDAAMRAFDVDKRGWEASTAGATIAAKAVGSFGTQMLGLSSAQSVVTLIIDHFKELKRTAFDASEATNGYRLALLELAALKGQLGETSKTLGQDISFRAQTLQTAAQSQQFQQAALGMGQSAIGNQISKEEFEKAMVRGGAFQAAEGASPATHGSLVGMIPTLMARQLKGRQMSAKELFEMEQKLYAISQPGGEDFTPMIDQYLGNASYVTSGLITPERMMALQSGLSTTVKRGTSGTTTEQFIRGTTGGLGKMRGMKEMAGEAPNEKLAEYLRRIGATDQMDPIEIGQKVSEDLTRAEAEAKGNGKEFNPFTYLQHSGYTNIQDTSAILAFHGLNTSGKLGKEFLPLAERPAEQFGGAQAKTEQFQRTDPAAQKMKADLAEQAANIQLGAGPKEALLNLNRVAFERLKGRGEVGGKFDESLMNRWNIDPREMIFGTREKMNLEAQSLIEGEARRLGIKFDDSQAHVRNRRGEIVGSRYGGDKYIQDLMAKVNAAGGTSTPGLEGIVGGAMGQLNKSLGFEGRQPVPPNQDAMTRAVEANTKAVEANTKAVEDAIPPEPKKPMVPAPLPAKPVPPAMRPAG